MNAWIVYIDLDQTYHKQSLLQFMAVIHLTGSIALFIFGGAMIFLSLLGNTLTNPTSLVLMLTGIGLISGGVAVAKAASKPTQEILEEYGSEELKDYERDYLARQGIKSTSRKPTARRKPAETRESENNFCDNCGKSLRPTAKFCGSCGTSVP